MSRLFEQPNLKAFRSTCRQTLQHELKHAFDDWIKLSKNLVPKHKEYQTVLNFIKGTNLPPEWKTCFEHCAYLLSNVEISAHQQQYLDFYKNHEMEDIEMENSNEHLIVTIGNKGYSEKVMTEAKKAGATGGTTISGRGYGENDVVKFLTDYKN